jgi:hypothetical protein
MGKLTYLLIFWYDYNYHGYIRCQVTLASHDVNNIAPSLL